VTCTPEHCSKVHSCITAYSEDAFETNLRWPHRQRHQRSGTVKRSCAYRHMAAPCCCHKPSHRTHPFPRTQGSCTVPNQPQHCTAQCDLAAIWRSEPALVLSTYRLQYCCGALGLPPFCFMQQTNPMTGAITPDQAQRSAVEQDLAAIHQGWPALAQLNNFTPPPAFTGLHG
jgi:hypothetical protein